MTLEANIRAIIETHVKRLITAVAGAQFAALAAISSTPRAAQCQRDYSCIAPGCKVVSKGPRFSYCCEEHFKQARAGGGRFKGTIEAWRKAALARRKAVPFDSTPRATQAKLRDRATRARQAVDAAAKPKARRTTPTTLFAK
jgi:hypothetical protein